MLAHCQEQGVPEVGLGALTSGGQFYKESLGGLGDSPGDVFMRFLGPGEVVGEQAGQEQAGWQPRGQQWWQPEAGVAGGQQWQQPPGGQQWQQQPYVQASGQAGGQQWQQQPGGQASGQAGGQAGGQQWQQQPGGQASGQAGGQQWQQQPGGQASGQASGQAGGQQWKQADPTWQQQGQFADTLPQVGGQVDPSWMHQVDPTWGVQGGPWQPGFPAGPPDYPPGPPGQVEARPPCSAEPPVFPAVYGCKECAWMYEQELPCWQKFDPCSNYYNCPPATSPPRGPTTPPTQPPTPPTQPPCIGTFTFTLKGLDFTLYSPGHGLTWYASDAKAAALGDGWMLATVDDQTLAKSLVRKLQLLGCSEKRVWVGGNQIAEAGRWVWADGAAVVGDFWDSGEAPPQVEECMLLLPGGWAAQDCADQGRGHNTLLAQKDKLPGTTTSRAIMTTTEVIRTTSGEETTTSQAAATTTQSNAEQPTPGRK